MRGGGTTLVEDEQGGITRSKALKVGAASVLGATLGSLSFLPGRARAANLYPAPCKPGQGYKCGGVGTHCGAPGSTCGCATLWTGSKLQSTKAYCVEFNVCCSDLNACPAGPSQCPPGYTCSASTCCGGPVCMPPCGANVSASGCCLTPSGSANDCQTCVTGGNCNVGFNECSPCGGVGGSFCFTTTEGTAVCGQNEFCDEVPSCNASSDCADGWVCITSNGCTGCGSVGGVCVPLCTTSVSAPKQSLTGRGMTAAKIRY